VLKGPRDVAKLLERFFLEFMVGVGQDVTSFGRHREG
jgi:hypothetical protein